VQTGYPTAREFGEAKGATYIVTGGTLAEGDRLELVLSEVRPHREDEDRPFSVEFRGPLEPQLPQATYAFERDGVTSDIFIVPVERKDSGVVYEAVFA